jgi:hypothetical protein
MVMANTAGGSHFSLGAMVQSALPTLFVAGGVFTLLLLAWLLGSRIVDPEQAGGETFRFIALVIIFMAALTLSAAVFVGLKLGNAHEAFGLPSGSVRALLAIGVMILFVVFGLPTVSPDQSEPIMVRESVVPRSELAAALQLHREQGLRLRVLDYGSDAVPATATTPPQIARPARFETYGRLDLRSPEEVDFGKQILTAIITLLTSVISFYFGSRSATEAARETSPAEGSSSGADLNLKRKQLEETFANLKGEIDKVGKAIDSLKGRSPPTDQAVAAQQAAELAAAGLVRQEVEAKRDHITRLIGALGTKLAAIDASATAEEKGVSEREARERVQEAEGLIRALEQQQAAYAAQVAKIPR